MKLKESNYNFYLSSDVKDEKLMYNSRTNALMKLADDTYNRFIKYTEGDTSELTDEEIKQLVFGGYLLHVDIDELDLLRKRIYLSRYNNQGLSLTIAPTLKCNFKCPYCYEDGEKPGKMPIEIQDRIIELVSSRKDTLKSLNVSWYGGEPLLEFDVIENLSKQFMKICAENKIEYNANIVTNGYLLSNEVANKLKEFNVSFVQVTIDGPPEVHNKTRILHNGKGTFDTIVKNVEESMNIIKEITIRVNLNKNNYLYANKLVALLRDKKIIPRVKMYFAKIDSINNNESNNSLFSDEQFDQINLSYRKQHNECLIADYPKLVGVYCAADSFSGLVVTSDGYIYKCWEHVGHKDKAVGDLLGNEDYHKSMQYVLNENKFTMYDATHDEFCKDCNILPICMGGCPLKREKSKERCAHYKYNLDEKLKYFVKNGNNIYQSHDELGD